MEGSSLSTLGSVGLPFGKSFRTCSVRVMMHDCHHAQFLRTLVGTYCCSQFRDQLAESRQPLRGWGSTVALKHSRPSVWLWSPTEVSSLGGRCDCHSFHWLFTSLGSCLHEPSCRLPAGRTVWPSARDLSSAAHSRKPQEPVI